jgi:hypothetical protein
MGVQLSSQRGSLEDRAGVTWHGARANNGHNAISIGALRSTCSSASTATNLGQQELLTGAQGEIRYESQVTQPVSFVRAKTLLLWPLPA